MYVLADLRSLGPSERKVILASYLGWTLDAFDFFVFVFLLQDVAKDFGVAIKSVTLAITLTLAMRPLGALIFGMLADRFGRRPTLMLNILIYSTLEAASGFAPSLTVLIILRALYGVAMGGEWGVGASLTLESVPPRMRGLVSGILQTGYPSGYFLASAAFYLVYPYIGWRGMFVLGVLPALLIFFIRRHVAESPNFDIAKIQNEQLTLRQILKGKAGLFAWAVVMMAGFNFLSHGTQDLYPTFLQTQRHLDHQHVGIIALIYNFGAICGGLTFGILSDKIGRRRAIVIAALLVVPVVPLWTAATTQIGLALGAFMIQFFAQGAWGVVPVHLNEMSPDRIRGTFPGVVYQLGNLLAAYNATLQAQIASAYDGNYALALGLVAATAALLVAVMAGFGPEKRGVQFGHD